MWNYFVKGGPLMPAIILCSIAAGTFSVIAWLQLSKAAQKHSKRFSELYQASLKKDWTFAVQICSKETHSFFRVWKKCFTLLLDGKHDLQDIEEIVTIEAEKLVAELESPLKPLSALIGALPMLGFLGTIMGLIVSFQTWEQLGSQVNIGALAGGIYQAMITTAAGLIAAIPYHFIYFSFASKAQGLALQLSEETTYLLKSIKQGLLLDDLPYSRESITLTKT